MLDDRYPILDVNILRKGIPESSAGHAESLIYGLKSRAGTLINLSW